MFANVVKPDPATILVIGILCCLFGVLFAFSRKFALLPLAGLLVAACAVPIVVFDSLFEMPLDFRWVGPVAISGIALILIARSGALTHVIARSASFLQNPVFCGGILLVLGVAVLGFACNESDPVTADTLDGLVEDQVQEPRAYQPAEGLKAFTDRGNDLPLFQLSNADAESLLAKGDQRLIKNQKLQDYLIRIAGASAQTNCHGWVFTGGLCWISTDGVEKILVENGYQQIEMPANGDLVIYRDEQGAISHSGIVRAVWSEGRILVESKWGTLGAFVHFVEQSIYPGRWTFHRTDRSTHLLRGLPNPSASSASTEPKGS